jgi:hypothetical protein
MYATHSDDYKTALSAVIMGKVKGYAVRTSGGNRWHSRERHEVISFVNNENVIGVINDPDMTNYSVLGRTPRASDILIHKNSLDRHAFVYCQLYAELITEVEKTSMFAGEARS